MKPPTEGQQATHWSPTAMKEFSPAHAGSTSARVPRIGTPSKSAPIRILVNTRLVLSQLTFSMTLPALSKWNAEAGMTVRHDGSNRWAAMPSSPTASSRRGRRKRCMPIHFSRRNAWKMAALKLRSFSRRNPRRTYSHSRSKAPKTSTSSISRSYRPRKSPRVPFGLKTSSAPMRSTTRPKQTTE